MQSDGTLATNEYMTILVKLPLGTFKTNNKLNSDFQYYYFSFLNSDYRIFKPL